MLPRTHLARVAGFFYIVLIIAGGWSEFFVRGDVIVEGDAAATAANIADATTLMRWGFAADAVMIVGFLVVGLALHALLRDVSRQAATAMLTLNAVSVAVMSVNLLNHAAAVVAGDERYAAALGAGADGSLAAFFLDMHGIGYMVAQLFFGLYLIPLGYLVIRSGWVPRAIGGLLVVGGVADMAQIGVEFLAGEGASGIAEIVAAPAGIAELTLALWLIVKGLRLPATARPVAAPA